MPEEIKADVVQKTQKILGKYVKKPQLTEKLLKKPPFRFLHDIVNAVIRETGFLKGLFSEAELNSDNVKEREAKIAFLTKLIEAIKSITNTELNVKPSKIVAGLEPTETNILLQTIGRAIDKKLDSSQYIKQLKSGEIANDKKKIKKVEKKGEKSSKSNKKDEKIKTNTKVKQTTNDTSQSSDRTKSKTKTLTEPKLKENITENAKLNEENETKKEVAVEETATSESLTVPLENIEDTKPPPLPTEIHENVSEQPNVEGSDVKKRNSSTTRPKSARPKSGDFKDTKEKVETLEVAPIKAEEPVEIETNVQNRPKSTLRPPSVRPSSARPGAPRLRPDSALPLKEVVTLGKINVIVENVDNRTDDDDDDGTTVVIQNTPEIDEKSYENLNVPDDNKGHLVEQILEQIEGESDKGRIDKNWEQDVGQIRDVSRETSNLRNLIQNLTKTANPLGKLLNYLHEDVDAMQSELEMWTNTKKQLYVEIAKQKKISAELNKPLLAKLNTLNEEIKKIENEIVSTRSNILKNDSKIKELLSK